MTANFARSICLAAYLTLAACASAPTPNQAPSAKAPAPAVERRQPAPPKTNTDATFALLSEADTALMPRNLNVPSCSRTRGKNRAKNF